MELLEPGIFFGIIGVPLPIQIRDFVLWTNFRGGIAMTIQTKRHAQGLIMVNLFHLVDRAMAFDATDAAINVHRMVEINEIRHAMNLNPGNRFATLRTFANQRETWIILEHLVMAIHAGRTGGDIRIPGFLDRVVAVTAINAELAGVSRVGK